MPENSSIHIALNALTPEIFLTLYRSVGWDAPEADQVRCALENTPAAFTAYAGDQPVGMLRLLGDGGMSFYLKDFAVLPAFQARGVGKALIDAAQAFITERIESGWAVSLELISTPAAVGFYRRQGFEERPCAWDGPGMFKMLRKE